jgi:hypothetical protein
MDMRAAGSCGGRGGGAAAAALIAFVGLSACDAPVPAPAPAPALEDVGALRAKVSACTGIDAPAAFTFFWPARLGGVTGARDCVTAAQDCAAVLACAGYANAGCSAANDRCDDGAAFACVTLASGLTVEQTTACAGDPVGNGVCSIEDDAKNGRGAFCHGAACAAEHCDESVIVRCRGGFEVRSDCAVDGMTCAVAGEQAFCAYDDACAADRCAGDVLELCNGGRVTLREPCAALVPGSTCVDRGGVVECLANTPSPGCADETEFASWCEGDLAVTCLAGVRAEADCGALPGGRCQSRTDGGWRAASCVAAEPF